MKSETSMTSIRNEVAQVGDSVDEFVNIDLSGGLSVRGETVIDSNRNAFFETIVGSISVELEALTIEDNKIVLNSNLEGPPPSYLTSGIEVRRGDEPDYQFKFRESDLSFVIGQQGDLQAVATRQDDPVSAGVPYWNTTANRFDTGLNATLNDSGVLTVAGVVVSGSITTPNDEVAFSKPLVVNYDNAHGLTLNTSVPDSEVAVNFQRNGTQLAVIGYNPVNGVFMYDNVNGSFPLYSSADRTGTANRFSCGFEWGTNMASSAQLQIDSTTRGFLPPRMTTTQRNAIVSPVTGLEVYDSTNATKSIFVSGTGWVNLQVQGRAVSATTGAFSDNVTVSGTIICSNSTASTNTTSGALQVAGGAGIGGDVFLGGALSVTGIATVGLNLLVGNTVSAPNFTATGVVRNSGRTVLSTSRVGGSVDDPDTDSALLEVRSTTQGFLPPRMTTAQRNAIASPADGLMIHNTTTQIPNVYTVSQWMPMITPRVFRAAFTSAQTGTSAANSVVSSATLSALGGTSVNDLLLTITPLSTNSTFHIFVTIAGGQAGNKQLYYWITKLQDGVYSKVLPGDFDPARTLRPTVNGGFYTNNDNVAGVGSVQVIDIPNTTSMIEYRVQVGAQDTGSAWAVNRAPNLGNTGVFPCLSSHLTIIEYP